MHLLKRKIIHSTMNRCHFMHISHHKRYEATTMTEAGDAEMNVHSQLPNSLDPLHCLWSAVIQEVDTCGNLTASPLSDLWGLALVMPLAASLSQEVDTYMSLKALISVLFASHTFHHFHLLFLVLSFFFYSLGIPVIFLYIFVPNITTGK